MVWQQNDPKWNQNNAFLRETVGNKLSDQQLQIQINHAELKRVYTHSLLGVKIDNKLSFDEQVDYLCKTLSQRIAVLRKIKRFLPLDQRILYYNAMIKQVGLMLYGSTAWSSCSIQNLQKVFRLQKRAARVILDANLRANMVEVFKKLNWRLLLHPGV